VTQIDALLELIFVSYDCCLMGMHVLLFVMELLAAAIRLASHQHFLLSFLHFFYLHNLWHGTCTFHPVVWNMNNFVTFCCL
jgi:hypothetical protein